MHFIYSKYFPFNKKNNFPFATKACWYLMYIMPIVIFSRYKKGNNIICEIDSFLSRISGWKCVEKEIKNSKMEWNLRRNNVH